MKVDFLSGAGGGGGGEQLPHKLIEARMRALNLQPLDNARRPIRIGLIAAALFLGIFALFAALAPISSAAIASAVISVTGDKLSIQPSGSGIVTAVLVHEGQAVESGQPLVRLNGIRSGAALRQALARRDSLEATEARLIAERDGAAEIAFPAELTQRARDPATAAAIDAQRAIFQRHTAILAADRDTGDQEVVAARAKAVAADQQLSLLRRQLADYRALYAKGLARKVTILSMEQSEADLVAQRASGGVAQQQARLAAMKTRDQQAMTAAQQLDETRGELAQLRPQLDVTRYLADQDVLRAPAAGRVSGLVELGPGMVVGAGRALMEIVPTGKPLVVEAQVKPEDVSDVRLGQAAMVRFTSINPHGRSAFPGRVTALSPARIEAQGGSYYKAEVMIDDPAAVRRSGLTLQPGLPASVTIKTRNRTLFAYLAAPLTDAMSKAFRQK